MPCDSAAASFHVPVKSTAPLAAELLALALALALADEAEALVDAAELEAALDAAELLAAEELDDPPHAASDKHATMRHTTAAITATLVRCFISTFMEPPFRLAIARRL